MKKEDLKKYIAQQNKGGVNYIEVQDNVLGIVSEVGVKVSDWVYMWFLCCRNGSLIYSNHYSMRTGKRRRDLISYINLVSKVERCKPSFEVVENYKSVVNNALGTECQIEYSLSINN
ncbi:MAG: hypothetical protein ACRDD8_02875 [Bacteroidales bacterium]